MNKIVFEIETKEEFSKAELDKMNEIIHALFSTGGLTGMKNGSTSIHFDKNGDFQAIRLDYTPWRKFTNNT